jgi:hypothetical protein
MNKINPTGLKGYEISERMKELMGIQPVVENKRTSVVHLTKLGPDGKIYGIVRENHEYYIKTANNKPDLKMDDFQYIGGLKNKKDYAYNSYEKATRHLNLKFISLCEAYNIRTKINILENDNLLAEGDGFSIEPKKNSMFQNESSKMSECCGAAINEGKCSECGGVIKESEKSKDNPWAICTASVGREDKAKFEKCVMDVKKEKGVKESLNEEEFVAEIEDNDGEGIPTNGTGEEEDTVLDEVQQAVEDMTEQVKVVKKTLLPKKKLSIETSINEMDNIIDGLGSKKKVQPK